MKKIAAAYSIVVGIAMIGTWILLYVSNQIPELQTEPIRIIMHLAAEYTTAILLIVAGYGLLRNIRWGFYMYLFSTGMLIYTLIMSPGYYAQQEEFGFVGMFAALMILAIVLLIGVLREDGRGY